MDAQLIDRSKPVPLYHQVKDSLRERIEAHEWEPGMKIPTEKELAKEYDVSQITVKQALSRLAMEGLVERYQGRGTFGLPASACAEHSHSGRIFRKLCPSRN